MGKLRMSRNNGKRAPSSKGHGRRTLLQAAGLAAGAMGLGLLDTPKVFAAASGDDSVVISLPQPVQQYYELATTTPLGPSIYRDFKPKKEPPWLIGYASSFGGNTWRIGARTRLQEVLLPKYKAAGLVSDVVTTESNLVIPRQIQQIRQLVDQGCDAIMTIGAAHTALDSAIKYAHDHGVLFVAIQGGVASPYALQISGNYALCGKLQGQALGKKMGGKGNALIVQGIPQAQASDDFQRGHEAGLKEYPDIKIIGAVAGNWVDSVAKTKVLQFLATHPEPLSGIATQSPGDLGALSALQQTGRTVVPMTPGGEMGPLAYWRDHQDWIDLTYQGWPPGDEMEEGWEVMLRTLQGQGPKIASILIGPGPIAYKDLDGLLPKGTTYTSNEWVEPPYEQWFPSATMDMYFERPASPLQKRG
ncbi:MAG TPA: substrate-binding domain-containing protein [Acetobacteraceae bacterium]|nr:substrate-binding domain-containing protein [Acetobacteraceae bacterium]